MPTREERLRTDALQLAIFARGQKVNPADILETAKLFFKYLAGEPEEGEA
jgi:hypothetical protein